MIEMAGTVFVFSLATNVGFHKSEAAIAGNLTLRTRDS